MNKIEMALARISAAYEQFGDGLFLGHSGGKDSAVIYDLMKKVVPKFTIVHNVKPMLGTSGDPVGALTEMWPETLTFLYSTVCVENKVTFMHSSMMPDFIFQNGLECQIDGARIVEADRAGKSANIIRNGESVSRALMTDFEPNGIFGLSIYYPIFDWTDKDVFDYIHTNGLPLSKEYEINGELELYRSGRMK